MSEQSRIARKRRHRRVRKKVSGTASRPRLNVFRSLRHIYAQIINDEIGRTLVSGSTLDTEVKKQIEGLNKAAQARVVGKVVAERALAQGVREVSPADEIDGGSKEQVERTQHQDHLPMGGRLSDSRTVAWQDFHFFSSLKTKDS